MDCKARLSLRCTETDRREIQDRARTAKLSVSEYMRRATLGRVINSAVDQAMVGELRRLGAMLKAYYPKTLYWTLEEKRAYWSTQEQLIALAKEIGEIVSLRK